MPSAAYELSAEQITFRLSPPVPKPDKEDLAIIGQARAMEALILGLGIQSKGYNIFIMGLPGTGRRTALLKALTDYTVSPIQLQDKVFVYDFQKPIEPRSLDFPAGKAREFKKTIHELVEDVKRIVSIHAESEEFKTRRDALLNEIEGGENRALSEFESELAKAGFRIVQIADSQQQSTDILPVQNGEITSFEDLQGQVASGKLSEDEWNTLRERYYGYMDRMKAIFEAMRRSRIKLDKSMDELRRSMLEPLIESQIHSIKTVYENPKIVAWLDSFKDDLISHLFYFDKTRMEEDRASRRRKIPSLSRYGVNIIVDRADCTKAPVVFENRPNLANLVGFTDQNPDGSDEIRSGYLRIRAGSILQASGGVLIIRAEDILQDDEAWLYLKRVLQTGKVEIQSSQNPLTPSSILKPEPVDVSLKVVMIGGELSYDLLYQTDPDFQKLFKVCAEFDSVMDRTPENEQRYAAFIQKIIEGEGLRRLTPDATVAVLARSVRLADHRDKLTTCFSSIADLLREADWWASCNGETVLNGASIQRALDKRAYLQKLPEEKLESMIITGEILLELEGSAIGKANGLAVHDRGYYAFGCPVVVSARVSPGDGGVINIEGESGLSGEIFDKAVLILSGYLRSRYARSFPLSVTASICFEQSYTPIEGDSATAVQLCSILSALAGVPLRQDLAITGSVNQLGVVQSVGGVSEKVEGFFSICTKRGLSGSQGVIIPHRNIGNLILSRKVEEAVSEGVFHIFAIDTIDQALEVLTGKPAGQEDRNGDFPEVSVNGLVSRELRRMADIIHRYET